MKKRCLNLISYKFLISMIFTNKDISYTKSGTSPYTFNLELYLLKSPGYMNHIKHN